MIRGSKQPDADESFRSAHRTFIIRFLPMKRAGKPSPRVIATTVAHKQIFLP